MNKLIQFFSSKHFKKLLWKITPSFIKSEIIKNSFFIPSDLPSNIEIKLAETREEIEDSFRLVYKNYVEMAYCEKNVQEMRATIYHMLPTTSIIIAKENNQVVGTLSVVRDSSLHLPIEIHANIEKIRKPGEKISEITSLSIDKKFRRTSGGLIFFPLLKFMHE